MVKTAPIGTASMIIRFAHLFLSRFQFSREIEQIKCHVSEETRRKDRAFCVFVQINGGFLCKKFVFVCIWDRKDDLIRWHSGYAYCRRTVLPLPAQSSAVAGAQFSRCGGNAVPAEWQSSPTAVRELCAGSQRTVRRQSENCATEVGELCY